MDNEIWRGTTPDGKMIRIRLEGRDRAWPVEEVWGFPGRWVGASASEALWAHRRRMAEQCTNK